MKIKEKIANWSTSKTSLYLAIVMVILYTFINIIISVIGICFGSNSTLDSVLTTEWFEFWKWVVAGSGSVSIFKLLRVDSKEVKKKVKKVKDSFSDEENKG